VNDAELLTMVKDSFDPVRAETQMDTIVHRARTLRSRRRGLTGAAWTAAAAAALALALVLVSSSSPAKPGLAKPGPAKPGAARLAAWTVTRLPGGIVEIMVRELKNPAGLQRKLHADGVPAFVRFANQQPPGCLNWYPGSPAKYFEISKRIFLVPSNAQIGGGTALDINPAAIPRGLGVWLEVSPPQTQSVDNGMSGMSFGFAESIVYASGRCPPG
jgi:hypothetical protein